MDMDMEQQQLDPKLANKTLWLNQEEEEEEEEEVGVDLLARGSSTRHRLPNENEASATATATGAGAEGELEPAPAYGTAPEMEDAPVTADGGGNSVYFDKLQGLWKCRHCNWDHKIGDPCMLNVQGPVGYLHMLMSTKTLNQWCLDTKDTESINETNEMQSEITKIPSMDIDHQTVKISEDEEDFGLSPAPVEHLHEAKGSFKHFEHVTEAEVDVDLIEETEEDLVDLDVKRVLDEQNAYNLVCPKCRSCITKTVILVRKRPKVSKPQKPRRGSKVDPIPDSAGFDGSNDKPETHSDVSPVAAPTGQNDGREQEQEQKQTQTQEAFSCLSCFSLFIPIGNGCFKMLQSFGWGGQTDRPQSVEEIRRGENIQRPPEVRQGEHVGSARGTNPGENTRAPQGIKLSDNTQSPQVVSHHEDAQSPQHIIDNEDAQKPRDINWNEDTQNPQKISPDANMSSPQHIKHNEDAQKAQPISWNEDKQSPQNIGRDENVRSSKDINQNNNKQSPQKITTERTNWIFSIFTSKSKETATQESSPVQVVHAISVQSAAVPAPSLTDKGYIVGAAIKAEEPGISDIPSSTKGSLLDNLKVASTEQPVVGLLQRIVGDKEIKDIETGLLERTHPGTDVAPSSQRTTETEPTGSGPGEVHEWEILKSIVYGGLIESITSLGVVSSAAGAGADTLNILGLGVANLIGGLIILCHNLRDLRNDQRRVGGASDVEEDRYQELLGRRQNFVMHVIVAVLSFLVFGLVPPVVYGFSFRKSDDKDLKLAAVAGASLICIFLLALGKAHVSRPHRTYFRSVFYYIGLGITASGISYVVGQLIKRLLEQLGLFESSSTVSLPFLDTVPMEVGRASY
ncbi:hypothetical protein GQ457_17G022990 [Hibiscus cannabinus]